MGTPNESGNPTAHPGETRPDDPVAWLYGLQHLGIKLGLEQIRALLELLGHPEQAYPAVLVAGTNGKGSVCAMLEALLRAHGVRTGLFTSPHLVRPEERIGFESTPIDTPAFDALLRRMRATIERGLRQGRLPAHPSFFETITGAALEAFRDRRVGCAVLEVGLGGRLDATNAVPARWAVVVNVDYDHTNILGSTLEAIAREKAAIAKTGRPFVSGVAAPQARRAVREVARALGAELVEVESASELGTAEGGGFCVRTRRAVYGPLRLGLAGRHQWENARVALVAFERMAEDLGLRIGRQRVVEALAGVRWPGRLQWIPGTPPLLLDGAHNPAGARALAAYLRETGAPPVAALLGAMGDKEHEGIFRPLAAHLRAAVATRPPVARALAARALADLVGRWVPQVEAVEQPAEALVRARALVRPGEFLLVTGSLYLVGAVLALLENRPAPGPVAM